MSVAPHEQAPPPPGPGNAGLDPAATGPGWVRGWGLNGIIGGGLLLVFLGAALLGPLLTPFPPNQTDFALTMQAPGAVHWFGTDDLGRDVLSRTLSGIGLSLTVAITSVLIAAVIGVPLGLLAGYHRVLDLVLSRVVEVLMVFPNLVIAIAFAAIFGPSIANITAALVIAYLPSFIRVSRGEAMRLRGLGFIENAVLLGASTPRVLFRHLLPNSFSALLVQITVLIPGAILAEAMLSFLGLGIQPPAPALGTMLSMAQPFLTTAWWMSVLPGLAIVGLALGFNLFGDALQDRIDPRKQDR